ncbi:MAG: sulfatase family protein [Anaerolineae bacterium]
MMDEPGAPEPIPYEREADVPPNILFITCDQLRKDTLGCYGDPIVQTPNIDRLASRGARFSRVFTAYPVCAPNRASLATGRYPTINGVRNTGVILPEDEMTMMEVARRHGYATYGAGKMHFGPQWRFPPDGGPLKDPKPEWAVNPQPETWEFPWHGFEQVAITEDHRVGPYGDYLAEHGYDVWADPHSFTYPQHITARSVYPEEHHQTTWVGDRTLEFLEAHDAERPFFMWTSFVDPHHPFTPPAPYDTLYDPADMPVPLWNPDEVEGWPEAYRRKHFRTEGSHEAIGMHTISDAAWQRVRAFYYGMINLIDKQIGRILGLLERRQMLHNTIIAFTSDHGEMLGDHHLVFKGTTYDQVTNVPLIIVRPGETAHGASLDSLACSIDITPTLLELAGMEIPAGVQGASLQPLLDAREETHFRDAVLIENAGIRRSVRTADALLTWHGDGERGELYDLKADPHAFSNLWDNPAHADLQRTMMNRLIRLMAENVDPLPPRVGAC